MVDAGNLERNLYLTTQLIDMNVRMVVALNMYDALEHSGNTLNYKSLGQLLGVPMVPTVSRTGKGIDTLFHVIIGLYEGADFMGQTEEIRGEAMREFREWHDRYVPDHKFGSNAEEVHESADAKSYIRHIHINHGRSWNGASKPSRKKSAKTRTSVTNTPPASSPSSCWRTTRISSSTSSRPCPTARRSSRHATRKPNASAGR